MSVYDMIREVTTALGETGSQQRDVFKQQQGIANESADAMSNAMPAALGVSAQKTAGDFAAQEEGRAVKTQLGNDPNDPNSLLAILTQDFRENTLAARNQAAKIADMKQVTLFDDLPQFLINQVMLPDEINAYNGTMGKVKVAQEGIAQMQALTTASAQAARATAQHLTKESVAQQAEVDAAILTQKVNTLKLDALGYDSEGLKLTQHNNAQTLQWAMQEHSMRLQDAAAVRAAEQHKWTLDHKKETEAADEQYAKIVSAGYKSLELPPVDYKLLKHRAALGDASAKRELEKMYKQGMSVISTGSDAIGSTPGEAIFTALEIGGLKGQQNKPARDFLERVARDTTREMNLTPQDAKDPNTPKRIQAAIDDKLFGPLDVKTGKRRTEMGELYKMALDSEAPGNIFKAPDLPALVDSPVFKGLPSVKNNPLYESVIAPAVAAGITKSDPATMYALGKEAVARGQINDRQLTLGLADLYKSASASAYAGSGAGKFVLPYRAGYMTKIPDPVWGGDLQLDWTQESNWIMYHTLASSAKQGGASVFSQGNWR